MNAPVAGHPVRVIYAKLTSTGSYDVVARTANVSLEHARTLAERLLPGNPPLDASVGEEVAHLRPAEGGHVVLRFARYDWSDGGRGDVYITDIAWFSDSDFHAARANAFALVPHTAELFDREVELPHFAVSVRSPTDDAARLRELAGDAALLDAARTVVASAAAADPVLLVHPGDRARPMELFTLLLPPTLRTGLTFQTQAFRVPAVLPRVTLVDRGYANLREGRWKMLPSMDTDVPMELAGRLVALAAHPDTLALTHNLHDEAYPHPVQTDLRGAIARLVSLHGVAAALQHGDPQAVLAAAADADADVRRAALRQCRRELGADAVHGALVALAREDGDVASKLLVLIRDAEDLPAPVAAALADQLGPAAPDELVIELATRCAAAGDLDRLVLLVSRDRRAIGPRVKAPDTTPPAVHRLVTALAAPTHDVGAAVDLLDACTAVLPSMGERARPHLLRACRDGVRDAAERTPATAHGVEAMVRLQEAVARFNAAGGNVVIEAGASAPASMRAVLGSAHMLRALDDRAAGMDASIGRHVAEAVAGLEGTGQQGRELLHQLLRYRGVPEHELVTMPGTEPLLTLLGGNAQHASASRQLVAALRAAPHGPEDAVRDLAAAVLHAHAARVRLVRGGELATEVAAALSALGSAAGSDGSALLEVCLELVGILADPADQADFEEAALGDRMSVRLRRLDRSVALCRAVEREDRYERYATAVESPDVNVPESTRERLRDALGTRGLQRRLMRAVSSVVEQDA